MLILQTQQPFVHKFVYEHISYNTVEQAYQHKKSTTGLNKCREILFNADHGTQKFLGQRVKGLNEEEWNENRLQYMIYISIAKYIQHQDLCEYWAKVISRGKFQGYHFDDDTEENVSLSLNILILTLN